ncbi:peroxisomal trans-2-enoyl-CoA reductase-like [Clytia hemisphaerica]
MAAKFGSVFRDGLFKNQVAVVTGGGTGIGKAIAYELATLGCNVVISSRKKEVIEKSSKELNERLKKEKGNSSVAIPCNIRKEEEVSSLMKETVSKFGQLNYLVNNGGGQFISPFSMINKKGWSAVIDTNLNGTFHCLKEAYDAWMGEHGGSIVNITVDNFNGMPYMSHSGAARAGVTNLTKTLALEWAPNNIRINSVAPGVIYSDTAAANYKDHPTLFEEVKKSIPFKRTGTVEEISGTVCFLLSPAASFISGDVWKIDGAQSLNGHNTFELPNNYKTKEYSWQDLDGFKSKL